jgi:two-component system, NtrC family, sensor kinase
METAQNLSSSADSRLVEMLARTLRHEVGDLLQTVYSAVAIFQDRLPAEWTLEQRILSDLRGRAETCKNELDAVHDLVSAMQLSLASVDLSELVSGLAAAAAPRFPQLRIRAETNGPRTIIADPNRLAQVGGLLVRNACAAARREVRVRTEGRETGSEVRWEVIDDGSGVPEEQLAWLRTPFATTHNAQFGLGLALAQRVVQLHGGRLQANNRPEGGFAVTMILPLARAETAPAQREDPPMRSRND